MVLELAAESAKLKSLNQSYQWWNVDTFPISVISYRRIRVPENLWSELFREAILFKCCGGVVAQRMVLRQTMLTPEPREPAAKVVTITAEVQGQLREQMPFSICEEIKQTKLQ